MSGIQKRDCECWEHTVSLNFVDQRFPREALRHIYCPQCSPGIRKNEASMAEVNGWLVEYEPNLLKPPSATVRLVQNRKEIGSFRVYVEGEKTRYKTSLT